MSAKKGWEVPDFNSIKVQLERRVTKEVLLSCYKFQFHKGTIRTFDTIIQYDIYSNFNSIKVQLEPYVHNLTKQILFYFNSIKVQLELNQLPKSR